MENSGEEKKGTKPIQGGQKHLLDAQKTWLDMYNKFLFIKVSISVSLFGFVSCRDQPVFKSEWRIFYSFNQEVH